MEEFLVHNSKSSSPWFLGLDHPSMPDLYMFPFVERIVMLETSPWASAFHMMNVKDHAPKIVKFVNALRAMPQFKDQVMY